jgi:hypothetical protein
MFPKNRRRAAKGAVDALVHAALKSFPAGGDERKSFQLLLRHVRSRSSLLSAASEPPKRGASDGILAALGEIARRRAQWLRPLHKWLAPPASPFVQFRSLAKHLFARYPVPNFMAAVWLGGDRQSAGWIELFLDLGRGKSVRRFETPIRLTKGMASHFMQAPDDLSVEQALRWAQVRGLGGDAGLARTVVSTRLAAPTADEQFAVSLIEFLVRNAPQPLAEVREIIAFIYAQRFEPADATWGPGAGPAPLQPDFAIRGRSLRSLRRHMAYWREDVLKLRPELTVRSDTTWPATEIGPLRFDDGDRVWTVEELLSGKSLRVEGGIMRHCAASYVDSCVRGWSSIWSMKAQQGDRSRRVLTIEVFPAIRTIWQAKGRRNSAPDERSWCILKRWAEEQGLDIIDSVSSSAQ